MVYLNNEPNDHVVYLTTGYMGIKSLVYNPNDIDSETKEFLDQYVEVGSYDIPNSKLRLTIITNDEEHEILEEADVQFFDIMDDNFIQKCKEAHDKALSNKHTFYCKSITFKNLDSADVNNVLGHDYTELYIYLINNILYMTQMAILGCKSVNYDNIEDMMHTPINSLLNLSKFPTLRDLVADQSEKIGSLQQLVPLHIPILDLYEKSKKLQPKDVSILEDCCNIVKDLATVLLFSNYYVIATDYLQYYATNSPNFNNKDIKDLQKLFDVDSKVGVLKLEQNILTLHEKELINVDVIEDFYQKLIPHKAIDKFIQNLRKQEENTDQTKNEDEDE